MKISDNTALKILFTFCVIVMFAPIFFAAIISCEKQEPIEEEIIDTTIYDSKINVQSVSRSGDGFYDFAFIFYNYKGQSGLNFFLQDAANSRAALMYWLSTFDTIYHIDTNLVRVHFKATNQNLKCNDNNLTINEGVSCKWSLVYSIANNVADGAFTVDRIGVFGNEKGSGGSDGDKAFYTGMGNHFNPWCNFISAAFSGIMWHELLHTYYINHVDFPCNKGSGAFTTNGGCAMVNCPIIPFYQQLIKQDFDLKTQ